MPDRRRQRQQRVRHDAGGTQNSVRASNKEPETENAVPAKPQRPAGSGVAYAEPKEYESVTIMPDKEVAEPEKYRRREVLNNWSRYEDVPTDEPELGEDYLMGEDFSQILEQQANSGGGHLRLKGESNWDESETSILSSHGLGALHVADLVASINTVPLYVQLNISEESLPKSVVEFYFQLAEDNRKVYQPTKSYTEHSDVNDKIIESLKISENEPINLISEEPETDQNTKNAVAVALALTSAFAPEPEDVDLDSLLQEPVVEQASPIRQPSPEKQPSPVRQPSPVKAPVKELTPVRHPSPVKEPVKEHTPVRHPSPVKEPSPVTQVPSQANKPSDVKEVKQPNPVPEEKSKNQRQKSKEKSPTSFDFGLPKKVNNEGKSPTEFSFSIPKLDVSANPKSSRVTKKVKGNLDLLNSLPTEKTEEILEGPTIDLDAPVEQSKPVLLISKTEAEDLEDWLDSVLDD